MQTHANAWFGVKMVDVPSGVAAPVPVAAAVAGRSRAVVTEATSFEEAVILLAAAVLALVALWLCLVTVATVVEGLTGVSSAWLRAATPRLLRRGLLLGCSLAVGAGAAVGPASAARPGPEAPIDHATRQAAPGTSLDGLPLPDRVTGAAPRADTRPPVARAPSPGRHRVRPGDSLWEIAARHLTDPSPAEVDAAWRSLYRTNRAAVGADPDRLVVGTWLALPPELDSLPPGDHTGSPERKDAA